MLHANPSLKMPAITRNQRKIANNVTISKPATSIAEESKNSFVANMNTLFALCKIAQGKENKMRICLEIYTKVNKELPKLIDTSVAVWLRFAAAVFNKTSEFINDSKTGNWSEINKKLVEKFNDEIYKTRNFVMTLIKNNWDLCPIHEEVTRAKEEITRLEKLRPRRNIPDVNYTGMDTIEPEDEFDGITDIWFDATIEEDSDYEFEEDEDDEDEDDEDEDDEEDEENKWAKIHPELSTQENSELKQYVSHLVEHHRVRRNVARVNYAGMDMSEEDEGQIHIAKRRFEDGKVKYIWKNYSLSQANEIDDEDYVDE